MLTRARLREKIKPFVRRMHSVAHVHRLAIIYLLAHEPMVVKDMTDSVGIPENLLAHHLKHLYMGGWVVKTKRGREVVYQLKEKAFFELFRMLEDTPFEREVLKKYVK